MRENRRAERVSPHVPREDIIDFDVYKSAAHRELHPCRMDGIAPALSSYELA